MRSRRLLAAVLALAVVSAAALFRPARTLSLFRTALASPYFPLFLCVAYLVRPFLAWPITVLSALVGFRYGLVGLPVALLGAAATSVIPYALAERFTPETPSGTVARLVGGSERYFGVAGDLRGVVVARLLPLPSEPVSAAAGAAGVSLPVFVLGTLVGELPWTVVAVLAGASMRHFGVPAGLDARLLVAAALVGVVLFVHAAYRN